MKLGVLSHYKKLLPITRKTPLFSLGEGDTPLVRCPNLERMTGCKELYFKLEGCNPTGSFKDRGMVVAVAKAVEDGSKIIMCASTGNTSASAAAYAAYLGLSAIIIIPGGHIAMGKLAQAVVYGARIISISGNSDEAIKLVRTITGTHRVALVNSVNPFRIEGQKTAAFEVIDVMEDAPDYLFIPVGNAGNITAYWKGFKEYYDLKRATKKPKMMGFQAEGAAPIVLGHPVENPETVATAIRIGNPASWQKAVAARDESGGNIDMVSDGEIMEAYHLLTSKGGIFGEPASAASFAGLLKMSRKGTDFSNKRVVCVITRNGLKDSDIAVKGINSKEIILELPAELGAIEKALGWG